MFFFIFAWLIVLTLFWLYWTGRQQQKHVFLREEQLKKEHLKKDLLTILGEKRFWNTPGIAVEWYVTEKRYGEVLIAYDNITLDIFKSAKQTCLAAFWLFFFLFLFFGETTVGNTLFVLGVGGLFFFLPDISIRSHLARRERYAYDQIPSFLDMLVLALQSGMGIEQSLDFVACRSDGVLSDFAKKGLQRLQWGLGFGAVLAYIEKVSLGEDTRHMVRSIRQARVLGVSLAQTLSLQSDLLRTKRRQQMEELSRTASVKISLPLVFCIFPALLMIYLGPGILLLLQK